MSGDILNTIDHVLADYEVGPDAMRWTPEPALEDEPVDVTFGLPRGYTPRVVYGASSVRVAPVGTSFGSAGGAGWTTIGFTDWVPPSAGDLELGQWTAPLQGESTWRLEFKVESVNRHLLGMLIGPDWAYSHPSPLACNGREYNRRRRHR